MVEQGETWLPIQTAPSYGDIAWGRFPYEEVRGPGPKERPVLVLAAKKVSLNKVEFISVQCAYGTSKLNKTGPDAAFQLKIENMHALNMARLYQATRFDLTRIRWMPWSARWFRPDELTGSPVIGRLPEQYIQRLEVLKALRTMQGG